MGTIQIDGSTPKLTIGNATAEDASIVYDGNAKDFYIALDDSADKLVIGEGSTVGTNSILTITDDSITIGDAAAVDTKIVFDGNAQDFYIALDDSADDLLIGKGSTVGTTPAIAIDENLKVNIPVTTASTSASTGSLTTGGGAGIGADLYVGDDVYLITDSAVLGFGADKDTLLTHTDGTGLTLNSTNKLCFNDVSQFIQGSSATVISIGATDEIDLTATAVDLNGTLDVSGISTLTGIVTTGSSISTGGETSPSGSLGAINIDTNALDSFSLVFKNSDVAHGQTDQHETDTYFGIQKASAASGGVFFQGFSETTTGIYLDSRIGESSTNTTKSTSAGAAMLFDAYRSDGGTGSAALASNGNIMAFLSAGTPRVIFDVEGEMHSDGGAQSAYDEYDDAQLIRACDLSRGKGTIDSKFDKFIAYNHEHLADLKLVGREEDGTPNHFINVTGMQRLHNGAIWQQYEKHQQLLEAVYDLAKEAVGEEKADAILDKHEVKRLQ